MTPVVAEDAGVFLGWPLSERPMERSLTTENRKFFSSTISHDLVGLSFLSRSDVAP